MEIKIIHFYPDLMSLYGSYANVSVLKRRLEQMGNTVTVKPILPGQEADLSSADFLYMGAGTEHAQKAALADFTAVQGSKRFVEDVYGHTDLYPEAVVGFMNKCSTISGVETPLLTELALGYGNNGEKTPEGFHRNNVFASQLTGPLLVKNPRMLDAVVDAIYRHRGESLPAERPTDHWAEDVYLITAEQLKLRSESK